MITLYITCFERDLIHIHKFYNSYLLIIEVQRPKNRNAEVVDQVEIKRTTEPHWTQKQDLFVEQKSKKQNKIIFIKF